MLQNIFFIQVQSVNSVGKSRPSRQSYPTITHRESKYIIQSYPTITHRESKYIIHSYPTVYLPEKMLQLLFYNNTFHKFNQ